ncbi:MAG: hypothetical protein Q9181_001946 [Wetmoreana brouardii]
MLTLLYLLTFVFSSASAIPSPQASQARDDACSLASFDRCGPANQLPGTKSTCNATVTPAATAQAYGVTCGQNFNITSTLNYPNCVAASTDICNKLTDPHVVKDRWTWTNPAYIGCAMGFWLPSGNGSNAAFAPDWNRCMVGIFGQMAKSCTNPSWNNVGSVNIKIMPDDKQTGFPVDPYYPSYVIAPVALTGYDYS